MTKENVIRRIKLQDLWQQAINFYNDKKYPEAIESYQRASKIYNNILENVHVFEKQKLELEIARLHYDWHFTYKDRNEGDDKNEAVKFCEFIINYYKKYGLPKNQESYHNYLKYLYELGCVQSNSCLYEEAISTFNEYIKFNDDYVRQTLDKANVFYGLGHCYRSLKRYEEAENAFLQSLNINAKNPQVKFQYALVKHQQATDTTDNSCANILYEEARNLYNKAIDDGYEDKSLIYFWIVSSYYDQEKYKEALDFYSKNYEVLEKSNHYENVIKVKNFIIQNYTNSLVNEINSQEETTLNTELARSQAKKILELLQKAKSNSNASAVELQLLRNKKVALQTLGEDTQDVEEEIAEIEGKIDENHEPFNDSSKNYPEESSQNVQLDITMEQRVTKLENNHEDILEILNYSGAAVKAKVQKAFDEYKEIPQLSTYSKVFYWTTINYFTAYRNTATDLLVKNINTESTQNKEVVVGLAKVATTVGSVVGGGIPIIGGGVSELMKGINHMIDHMYKTDKKTKFEYKEKAINTIIQNKFNFEEDLSMEIAKLTLKLTEYRKSNNTFCKSDSQFFQECKNLAKLLLGEVPHIIEDPIEIDGSRIAQNVTDIVSSDTKVKEMSAIALGDVVIFMNYLFSNYQHLDNSQPLYEQSFKIFEQENLAFVSRQYTELQGNDTELQGNDSITSGCCPCSCDIM